MESVKCRMGKVFLLCFVLATTESAFGFYNPQIGRWTTRDPIEENDAVNLYQFVGNNPIKNVYEMRSKPLGHYANQCIYDAVGKLMEEQPAAGTVDYYSTTGHLWNHAWHDWHPFVYARGLNRIQDYYSVRPSW